VSYKFESLWLSPPGFELLWFVGQDQKLGCQVLVA